MKKFSTVILTALFTYICVFCINGAFKEVITAGYSSNSDASVMVIDSGHGGIDAGTVGRDGALEKDINLSIAIKLSDFARASGFKARLIRDGDYLFYKSGDDIKRSDLYNRLDFVNSVNNSVLISIHQNHYEDEREWGTQIWYSPNDSESSVLADAVLNSVKNNLQKSNNRSNKKSDNSYYLLYEAESPSIMIECGFMSNEEENKRLQGDLYQSEMAYSIMTGYADYLTEV